MSRKSKLRDQDPQRAEGDLAENLKPPKIFSCDLAEIKPGNDRLFSLLGLAKKAGKLSFGFDATIIALSKGVASLIFVTCDLSTKTLKKLEKFATKCSVEIVNIRDTMDAVENAFGKRYGIVSVNDNGFAELIRKSALQTRVQRVDK